MSQSSHRTTTTEPVSIDSSVEVETVETVRAFRDDVLRHMNAMGISQVELARRLGSSPAYVSKILRGSDNLTVATLLKIGRALGVRVSLRLETPEIGASAAVGSKRPEAAVETATPADMAHGSSGASETLPEAGVVSVPELIEKLGPKVVHEIAKYVAATRNRPGRPKGSGVLPDDVALERMADLIIANEARSERQAADKVAAEDPGHSASATARRLRRKFAADRRALLAAARRRRQPQVARRESGKPESSRSAEPRFPSTVAATSSWSSTGGAEGTGDFVSALEEQFHLDRALTEALRIPHVLEEIADLLREPAAIAGMPLIAGPSMPDEVARIEDQFSCRAIREQIGVGLISENPARQLTVAGSSTGSIASEMCGSMATLATASAAAARFSAASPIPSLAAQSMGTNAAIPQLSSAARPIESLATRHFAPIKIPNQLEEARSILDPWGEIDRKIREGMNPSQRR